MKKNPNGADLWFYFTLLVDVLFCLCIITIKSVHSTQ